MSKEVRYVQDLNRELSDVEIAMIESARELPEVHDDDNPPIDPVSSPEQYVALMRAVAERNRCMANHHTGTA